MVGESFGPAHIPDPAGILRRSRAEKRPYGYRGGGMVDVNSALGAELAARTEERLRLALRAGDFGVWEWDVGTGEVTWSEEIYRFYGLDPAAGELSLDSFVKRIHEEDRPAVQRAIDRTLERNEPYHVTFRALNVEDEVLWLEAWGQSIRDSQDRPLGMIGLVTDATERIKAEEERALLLKREREARADAEAGRQRMNYLTQAYRVLGESLDLDTTTDRFLSLLVPHLGDWAAIYLYRDGRVEPLGWRHREPAGAAAMEELILNIEVTLDTPGGVGEVIRTGVPLLQATLPEELVAEAGLTDEQMEQLDTVGIGSYLVIPLLNQGVVIGAFTVGVGAGARPYSAEDLELAEQLAYRAGAAFHNAALFEERTSIAKVLQRSLLPAAFPDIANCELAGGYRSAGSGLDVGGDFYDVFQIDQSRFGVAIGDVSGKGHEAAAITALTRHTIRATAMLRSDPAAILRAVNDVLMEQSAESRFCTAALGVLSPGDDGSITVHMARAGHNPPLVVRSDGSVQALETPGTLLGLFPQIDVEAAKVVLGPGDVLVLYTDGLTDVSVGGGILGEDWLREELATTRKLAASEIARALEQNVARAGGVLTDDIAVLVLKVLER